MTQGTDKQPGVLRSLDWWTIGIYLALLTFGWLSVCGASYTYGDTDIFSLDTRSGMQIVWIGTSVCLGFVLLMLDDRFYDTFAYVIFGALLLLLFATIFNPHQIKGSRSWLVLGPLRLQPAEFAKFATALALAKFMSTYGYNIHRWKHFVATLAIILTPMLFIILQRETGSALVYLAFFLVFYREGMPGCVLFTGVAAVVILAGAYGNPEYRAALVASGASMDPTQIMGVVLGTNAGKICMGLLALAAFPSACFASLISANSFKTMLPKINSNISVGIGGLAAVLLAVTGIAGDAGSVFGFIGASFGPICGAMFVDYFMNGGKWTGPRAGFNIAGWLSWALGFTVGVLGILGMIPMGPIVAFIVGAVVYYGAMKAGLKTEVIPFNK